MGRPERPVDPRAGAVQRFAHELRVLREAAGKPTYRVMAGRTDFSVTVLAQAASGERLPSLAVVLAYARACGADPAEWELRWKTATEEASDEEAAAREEEKEPQAPYRGLMRFEPGDHGLFFGRDRLVAQLSDLVHEHRFAVVFGASGSGKSSLLRAGLIPLLQRTVRELGRTAVLRVLTPGATPAATHGRLLAPQEGEPDSWVVVDQFEEIYTLCRDRAERARFIDLLLAAQEPGSRLRVVVAVRADFYGRCAEHRGLVDALRDVQLLVAPMTRAELREAVVKPAAAAGLLVERALTARLVEEVVDQPGALPMLSHALLETWRRRRGRTLTMTSYESAGGVHGAIATTAEHVYGQLSPAQARTARQMLLRLIEPGQGAADTRRPVERAELEEWSDPEVPAVVEELARARLVIADANGVELAHEALMTCWPRLRGWIEEDRERLRHHRRLTEAARTWQELGRDPGTLYRGTHLVRAEDFFARPGQRDELTSSERAFLTAALDAREAERRVATRTTRRARRLVAALSATLAVALIAGMVAWQQHRTSRQEATDTAARRVAAVADAMRTTDPRTAMLLSVAAWRIAPLPETRSALLGATAQTELDAFTDSGPGSDALHLLVDSGRTLLSSDGRKWQTWDVVTHRRTASGLLPDGQVTGASPDGRVLAVAADSGTGLWDASAGQWTGGTGQHLPLSDIPGFGSSNRSYLVSNLDSDEVQLRSVTDGRVLFRTAADNPANVALSADGRLVAVCPRAGPTTVRDIVRHRSLPGGWRRPGANHCDDDKSWLAFDDGGDRLAAVSSVGVRVWDTASGRQFADIAEPDIQSIAFSHDGAFLAVSGHDEITVWRLSTPDAPVFRHPLNGQLLYGGLAWDPGLPILRYLEGSTVHSLDLGAALTAPWSSHPLDNALLSPDGGTLATAERSGSGYRFQLRDTRDGHLLRTLPSPPLPASLDPAEPAVELDTQDTMPLMAFSPDTTAFTYSVSAPGREASPQRFVIWDLTRDRERTTLDLAHQSSTAAVLAVVLGPGGRTLVASRTRDIGHRSGEVWNTARRSRAAMLNGLDSIHLAVRPDGRLLAGDMDFTELPSGPVTRRTLSQGEQINALTFSPDGSRMAAGDMTGRVALWDGTLRHRTGVLSNLFPAALGDTPEAVNALAFSPDGSTLAVAGDSGTLQLWDTATQQPLGGNLPTPGEPIRSLAFSSDSATLYATSDHTPLQRYPITPSHAITQACARTGTTLTAAQWHLYIPDAPYHPVCDTRRPH
ncbi:helix-turn-helix domain-containing protein [Streptomyces sp. WI04-05B]|uniref:nSTAND1 domain-containing NTPase n=1 Tax=Streptomyces TaxID=1883 RepID=UPI0029B3E3CA|nr:MULTISPECIES: helix-turn-helix domain-containing protein [unclassified Streptomyces]MDX2549037.1 helix-turn-helix domain-containing protein [Streptomyces sp. WI04-05B]MDX2583314.1 helix-turn-helix domain-containing protein [Streptomyces sp. WI04-05A]